MIDESVHIYKARDWHYHQLLQDSSPEISTGTRTSIDMAAGGTEWRSAAADDQQHGVDQDMKSYTSAGTGTPWECSSLGYWSTSTTPASCSPSPSRVDHSDLTAAFA